MASHSNSGGILLLVLASGFFIIAILFDYMPIIIGNLIKRNIELATNDEIKGIWSKPPIDIHSYYWLYNVTNPEQFMGGDKIRVQKVGPYHFTSRAEKKIIELSANKYRIIYNTTRKFHFNESEHELSYDQWRNSSTSNINRGFILTKIDDNLTLLNAAFATIAEASRELASKGDEESNRMLFASSNRLTEKFNETLLLNITARQALLGRKLMFVQKARKMIETFGIDQKIPNIGNNDTFGYVAILNNTLFGPYEIYTGYHESMSSLGDIISYQGKRRYSEYRGKCNRLQASAGELRPMPILDGQILEMSTPGFCRTVRLAPTGWRKLREGVAISYTHHINDFKNSSYNPDNECFCVNGTADNYCSLNGALEIAPCSYYSPIVVTTSIIEPDPRITTSIADFEPELLISDIDSVPKADSQAQLLILRRIGVPVKADLTYTLFAKVIRDPKFRQTASVPEVSYIPLVMIREMASIPVDLGQMVVNLENFLVLSQHMKVIMYLSSVVLLFWLTGHYYNRSAHDRVVPSNGTWRHSTNAPGLTNGGLASSDRANSADSSRSQPPSRIISQAGSTDINEERCPPSTTSVSTNQVTSDSLVSQKQKEKVLSSKRMLSNQQKALHQQSSKNLGNNNNSSDGGGGNGDDNNTTVLNDNTQIVTTRTIIDGKSGQQKQQNLSDHNQDVRSSKSLERSRFFSKVDQEFDLKRQRTSGCGRNQTHKQSDGFVNQALELSSNEREASLGNDNSNNNNNNNNDRNRDNKPIGESSNGNKSQFVKQTDTQIRKNWFMKVYFNLARILSDIRGTISEASQLDIKDNDYRDKQIEILAGKIDNWYNSGSNTAEASTPEKDNLVVHGNTSGYEGSVNTVHDQNTNDLGLKSSSAVEIEQYDGKIVDYDSCKLGVQANKAQVNNSEVGSNKISASESKELFKIEESEVTKVVGSDEMLKREDRNNKTEVNVDADVKEEKQEASENNVKKGEEQQGQGEKGDEKGRDSQTGSIRRRRTNKKKTFASQEKGPEGGYKSSNGYISTATTPSELAGNESVANSSSKPNLINANARSDEKIDDGKIDSDLPRDQFDALKVLPNLKQADLSNAGAVPKSDNQVNLAQNQQAISTVHDREDVEELETEVGKGAENDDEEEEEESSKRFGTRDGACIETSHHVNRNDSAQSNQRITNKSDTSGDESYERASLISAKQNKEDKAAAFEQIEMAMAIVQ